VRVNGFNHWSRVISLRTGSTTNSLRGSAEEAYTTLIRCSKSEIPV
jgi:hypothetical protein